MQTSSKDNKNGSNAIPQPKTTGVQPVVAGSVKLQPPGRDPKLQFRRYSGGQKSSPSSEFDVAYQKWKSNRSAENTSAMLNAVSPYIDDSVRKWTGSSNPVAVAKAKVMVIQAMDRYDPSKSQINTFIDRQLQPLNRWSAQKNIGIRLPREKVQGVTQLQEIEQDFEAEFGRAPSVEELATRMGMKPEKIQELQRIRFPAYSDAMVGGQGGEGAAFVEDQAVVGNQDLWYKSVYHSLPAVDQVIMQHTIGLYGSPVLSNQAIAKKLKITPSAVSQRKRRIQKLLEQDRAL